MFSYYDLWFIIQIFDLDSDIASSDYKIYNL